MTPNKVKWEMRLDRMRYQYREVSVEEGIWFLLMICFSHGSRDSYIVTL